MKTPPALTGNKHRSAPKQSLDTRGMLSIATMFVSLTSLSVSLSGAGRLIFDIFNEGLETAMEAILVKVIVVAFSFIFGWIAALICIRGFGNLVYPILIRLYAWICLALVAILYIKVIQKLLLQTYDGVHFWAYLMSLLGGLCVLISLHLLIEGHDLRPFSIPLMIVSVLHLYLIVSRYVFSTHPNGLMLFGDLAIFIVMISVSCLMLLHMGILSPLRVEIGGFFNWDENPDWNGRETNQPL